MYFVNVFKSTGSLDSWRGSQPPYVLWRAIVIGSQCPLESSKEGCKCIGRVPWLGQSLGTSSLGKNIKYRCMPFNSGHFMMDCIYDDGQKYKNGTLNWVPYCLWQCVLLHSKEVAIVLPICSPNPTQLCVSGRECLFTKQRFGAECLLIYLILHNNVSLLNGAHLYITM